MVEVELRELNVLRDRLLQSLTLSPTERKLPGQQRELLGGEAAPQRHMGRYRLAPPGVHGHPLALAAL